MFSKLSSVLHPVLKVSKVLTVQVDIWIRFKPSYLCTRQQPSLHFVLVSPFVSNGSQAKPFIFQGWKLLMSEPEVSEKEKKKLNDHLFYFKENISIQ